MTIMTDKRYNGWANYETWVAGMYISGNYTGESTYLDARQLVRDAAENYDASTVDAGIWTEQEARLFAVEDALKAWFVDQELPELDGVAADLLRAACDEIDWREIAEGELNEIDLS